MSIAYMRCLLVGANVLSTIHNMVLIAILRCVSGSRNGRTGVPVAPLYGGIKLPGLIYRSQVVPKSVAT